MSSSSSSSSSSTSSPSTSSQSSSGPPSPSASSLSSDDYGTNYGNLFNFDDEIYQHDDTFSVYSNSAENGKNLDIENSSDDELRNMTDLSPLFSDDSLMNLAHHLSQSHVAGMLMRHVKYISTWIHDHYNTSDEIILLKEFQRVMSLANLSEYESSRIFHLFQSSDSKQCTVGSIKDFLKSFYRGNFIGGRLICRYISKLQMSNLMPGALDVFAGTYSNHKENLNKILEFLHMNQLSSECLQFSLVDGYKNKHLLREALLTEILKFREHDSYEVSSCKPAVMQLHTTHNCFSSVEVSTNKSKAKNLIDGNERSYWESNGAKNTHWIRLHIKPGIIIAKLSLSVYKKDSSYMPNVFVVSLSRRKFNPSFEEYKVTKVPQDYDGPVLIASNLQSHYPVIQISIKCSGTDTRVHQVHVIGHEPRKDVEISTDSVAHLWYLQVLSCTALSSLNTSPQLATTILHLTRSNLERLSPLDLSPRHPNRSVFSVEVLDEMEKFIKNVAHSEDCSISDEGLHCLLLFELAYGNVSEILHCLQLILTRPSMQIDHQALINKLQKVTDDCLSSSEYSSTLCDIHLALHLFV